MYIFQEFVEFVVLLTKIWSKNIVLALQLNVGERELFRGLFWPPPPSHKEVTDAISVVLFYNNLY